MTAKRCGNVNVNENQEGSSKCGQACKVSVCQKPGRSPGHYRNVTGSAISVGMYRGLPGRQKCGRDTAVKYLDLPRRPSHGKTPTPT